jgi:hypothetical protein
MSRQTSMKKLPPEPEFRILYPYDGIMDGAKARAWIGDLLADGKLLSDEVDRADSWHCAQVLHEQGYITLSSRSHEDHGEAE